MEVIAEPEERIPCHRLARVQSQLLCAETNPLAGLLTDRGILGFSRRAIPLTGLTRMAMGISRFLESTKLA